MIANRKQNRGYFNNSTDRVTIVIESLPCVKGTLDAGSIYFGMMKQIQEDPLVLFSGGPMPFDRATIEHNGTCWVMRTETLVMKELK